MTYNDAGSKLSHPQTGVFNVDDGKRTEVLRINWDAANTYQIYRPLKIMTQEIFFSQVHLGKSPVKT